MFARSRSPDGSPTYPPAFVSAERRARGANALWGIALASPMLLAAALEPNAAGVGTHEQLGLPRCTFLWLTGIPCPFCGMTTSWAHAANLEVGAAFLAQPMGLALFLATLGLSISLTVRSLTGGPPFRPDRLVARTPASGWWGLGIGIALAWIYKIAQVRGWFA